MKTKIVTLKNRYSSETVRTEEYDNVRKDGNYNFILVYHPENPQRKFLVNRDAYVVVK